MPDTDAVLEGEGETEGEVEGEKVTVALVEALAGTEGGVVEEGVGVKRPLVAVALGLAVPVRVTRWGEGVVHPV